MPPVFIVLFILKKSGNSLVAPLLFDDALSSYARKLLYLALSVLKTYQYCSALYAKRYVRVCMCVRARMFVRVHG